MWIFQVSIVVLSNSVANLNFECLAVVNWDLKLWTVVCLYNWIFDFNFLDNGFTDEDAKYLAAGIEVSADL